jgi:signal transduction histidine kinase
VTTLEDVGASSWRGRAPLVIAGTIPLVILLALPWRAQHLAEVPGFSAIWLALLVGCDLLTVLVLWSQYRAGASPRLLALSWAFLWSAGVAVAIAAAVPGVLTREPTFATDANSVQWLWVSRHVVPPVLIALALAPWPAGLEARADALRGRGRRVAVSAAVVLLLIGAGAWLVAAAPERLPTITVDSGANRLDPFGTVSVAVLNGLAVVLAVWGVAKRRSTEGLERWAVVASVAFLGDVWLTALFEDRWTVAYYLARALGLAASMFVLLAVLRETSQIQVHTSATAQRLEERNAELLEANRLRDHLTAIVSHDLRTPLSGLQGYLELLRDDDLDSPLAHRMLERSWMLTRRLTLLTEDLLAAATLEHGDLVVTPEPVDVDQQLRECAACFPDLDLQLHSPPGLTAYADPLRLQQVLANLVRNAQKHGAEPVLIAARPDPAQPGAVSISVADAGPGVPAAFVPRLFDRYTQGPDTATGGSGLGLSVVRDLVLAHGGDIRYDRTRNAFVFTLPAPVTPPPAASGATGREPVAPEAQLTVP